MEDDFLAGLERTLRKILLILAAVAVTGLLLLLKSSSRKPAELVQMTEEETEAIQEEIVDTALADSTYWLPRYCNLYEKLPVFQVMDAQGEMCLSKEWNGQMTVTVCFSAWCESCQRQMEQMAEYEKIAQNYGNVTFVYLNLLDEEKETMENIQDYVSDLGIIGDLYFDTSGQIKEHLGVHEIPTTLFLNKSGQVMSWSVKPIEKKGVFEGHLENTVYGNHKAIADFVVSGLMDNEGGIHSVYQPNGVQALETEVLSESQGLFLLYAVAADEKELFDKALSYVKKYLWKNGIAAWKFEYGEASSVNALIDDLRIYRALLQAQQQWGEYGNDLAECEKGLEKYSISNQEFVDFYDMDSRKYAKRLSLSYIDLIAMANLSKNNEIYQNAYKNAEEILIHGQISNEFPLYYSWYNYDKKRYEEEDMNTAEAMMTLLQLARQGKLKNNTIHWLKDKMAGEGLKARYTVKGKVAKGYEYESTAVYALVAVIADEIGDMTLRGQALKKMEKMRIIDTSLAYHGAFGLEDGSGITSFDQLLPVLAYLQIEK